MAVPPNQDRLRQILAKVPGEYWRAPVTDIGLNALSEKLRFTVSTGLPDEYRQLLLLSDGIQIDNDLVSSAEDCWWENACLHQEARYRQYVLLGREGNVASWAYDTVSQRFMITAFADPAEVLESTDRSAICSSRVFNCLLASLVAAAPDKALERAVMDNVTTGRATRAASSTVVWQRAAAQRQRQAHHHDMCHLPRVLVALAFAALGARASAGGQSYVSLVGELYGAVEFPRMVRDYCGESQPDSRAEVAAQYDSWAKRNAAFLTRAREQFSRAEARLEGEGTFLFRLDGTLLRQFEAAGPQRVCGSYVSGNYVA